MMTYAAPLPQRSIFMRALAALTGGLLLFLLTVAVITGGYQLWYTDHIFPGVSVAGVDLSGLMPGEASLKLSQALTYPYNGQLFFRDGDKIWLATPAELGLVFDVSASVQTAYGVGRRGGLFGSLAGQVNAWQGGVDLTPVVILDQRVAYAYLQNIAAQIDLPVIEASLSIQGMEVFSAPGQIGRVLDVDATMVYLTAQLQSFRDGEIPLVITEQAPLVLDASAPAEQARRILSAPLVLSIPDAQPGAPGPWSVDVPTLAGMLVVERVGGQYQIVLDTLALRPLLQEISDSIARQPENARFIFNDDTRQLDPHQPAVIGRSLNVEATLEAITQKLLQGEHAVSLVVEYTPPLAGDDATAASLGITELVLDTQFSTTYFRGSSPERIQNIQTAAAQFHGLLIAPGETFSMGEALGDISLDNGYAEALIIYSGRTIKGVGGGVCQVSTTFFRAIFFAGYQIDERHSHAYRVYYYEQSTYGINPMMAGLDATVYFPLVDFRFTNDTPYWLLMETYVNVGARTLTWKLYSTSDGREVEWSTTGPQDRDPPPAPLFQENPDLRKNEIEQVDWAAEGANIAVTRIVRRGGVIIHNDVFKTQYQPWQAVCEYGPGTEKPQKLAKQEGLCQP